MLNKRLGTLLVLVILFVLGGIFLLRNKSSKIIKTTKPEVVEVVPKTEDAINGLEVSSDVAQRRPFAVMVENHPDSRPQSGLSDADVVYEALAEGGITRFMAVYQTKEPSSIGPIRSAREYYAVLANELGAVYVHVGGSNEVIGQLKNGIYKNVDDANEYYNENFFQRISSRSAPHNVYTSIAKLQGLIEYRKYSTATNYDGLKFKNDSPPAVESISALSLNISFSLKSYAVSYSYNSALNNYKRNLAGVAHVDATTKIQITPKVVVVQMVEVTPVPNDKLLSVDINLTGQGTAYIFQDGGIVEGTWKKIGSGRTRYYDKSGNEISFNRGQMWVELVPKDKEAELLWK